MSPVTVTGYEEGTPFALRVAEVEKGYLLRVDLVAPAKAMLAEARASGLVVGISSAWRSNESQTRLYECFKAGLPGFNPADPPGYSNHQNGRALDLRFATTGERERFASEIAPKHGFTRPVSREPWHFVGPQQSLDTRPAPSGVGRPAGGGAQEGPDSKAGLNPQHSLSRSTT